MPATHVALLRGINLGGRNKVAMADTTATACLPGCGRVSCSGYWP